MRDWLKIARTNQSLSQKNVADLAGISQQHYSLIENDIRDPSTDTAQAIAKILGFSWTRFFESSQEAS